MRLTIPSAIIGVLALLIWLTVGEGEPLPVIGTIQDTRVTESYLEHVERWTYDAQGQRNQMIRLASGIQYNDSPVSQLSALEFEGPDDEGHYWHITAGAGSLDTEKDVLELRAGVLARQSEGQAVLSTPELTIFMASERAATEAPVALSLPNSETTAIGLEFDLRHGKARLLHDVETHYVP